MLMEARAFNEGARAFVLWGALQVDISRKAQTEEERVAADDLLGLMTPVIKGYLTDKGFDAAVNYKRDDFRDATMLKVACWTLARP